MKQAIGFLCVVLLAALPLVAHSQDEPLPPRGLDVPSSGGLHFCYVAFPDDPDQQERCLRQGRGLAEIIVCNVPLIDYACTAVDVVDEVTTPSCLPDEVPHDGGCVTPPPCPAGYEHNADLVCVPLPKDDDDEDDVGVDDDPEDTMDDVESEFELPDEDDLPEGRVEVEECGTGVCGEEL